MINKIKNDELIKKIIKYSQNAKIYLVGGYIRDFVLNKKNYDKDIVVDCPNIEEYAKNLSEKLSATFITLDEKNKIYRLVLKDKINQIDIAPIIGNNLEDDLKRRDFTINSVAVDLQTLKIIDINNGIEDIKNKVIRGIYDKNFYDDPLRLLRAYRFQANLGFEIDEHLKKILDKNYEKLENIAIERIHTEILKLFEGNYTAKALENMGQMLEYLFPIIKEVKKIPPNTHHHLPLFYHSIETMKQTQSLYEKSANNIKKHLENHLGLLKIAAFLHDIGKPQTWTIEEETGRHIFIKHDDIGSKIVIPTLKNLNFSKKEISYIACLIKNHIYPSQVVTNEGDIKKSYMRFIRKMEENVIDVILLAMADRLSAQGPAITKEITNTNINGLKNLLNYYLNIKDTLTPLPVLLNGNEIIEQFKIKPSPKLGEIITQLKEAQLSGEINTKSEAIYYVRNILGEA